MLPYLKSRGTEKQALHLSRGLAKKGSEVMVFVVQGWGDASVYEDFRRGGASVINIGKSISVGQKRVALRRVFRLAALARRYNCDLLFSRATMTNWVCAIAGWVSWIPSIVSLSSAVPPVVRQDRSDSTALQLLRLIRSIVFLFKLGFPKAIVTVSKEAAANATSRYACIGPRVRPIQNGIDVGSVRSMSMTEPEIALPNGKFLVAFSGSVEFYRKGMDVLLAAMHRIVREERNEDVHLVIIGSGHDEDQAQRVVRDSQLMKNVTFVGETSNPHAYVSRCDVFVLPSRREGLPNVLLEAMATGVCSIAADCHTGPREIILHSRNGVLLPVGDSEALARSIIELKNDSRRRAQLALEGRRTVCTAFSHERMIEEYVSLFREVAGYAGAD